MDEARCRDQRVTGPECEGFVAALPGSMLESNGVLRGFSTRIETGFADYLRSLMVAQS